MKMFVLYDKKAQQWLTPFFSKTNGTAYRELGEVVRTGGEGNMLAQHPADFELHYVGDWDELKGEFDVAARWMIGSVDQLTTA